LKEALRLAKELLETVLEEEKEEEVAKEQHL
jgi:predicted RNase H-like HicB family nuclease